MPALADSRRAIVSRALPFALALALPLAACSSSSPDVHNRDSVGGGGGWSEGGAAGQPGAGGDNSGYPAGGANEGGADGAPHEGGAGERDQGGAGHAGGQAAGADGGAGTSACAQGEPAAFGPAASSFSLPAPRCMTKFDETGGDETDLSYSLLDVTYDGASDLVVTRDECDDSVGTSHWDVYPAHAAGFSPSPTAFALPAARCQTKFDRASRDAGSLAYGLFDATGDGRVDLVVTRDSCDATVGASHWDVYPAGPHGFATSPLAFALPEPRCQTKFDKTAAAGASLSFSLLDTNRDGRVDLVVTRDSCDATVGASHWDVYPAGPTGFATSPSRFALPAARCQTKFDETARGDGPVVYGLLDLAVVGTMDLLVTRDSCDATVGASHWDVYPAGPAGFAASPQAFALPAARCGSPFDVTARTASDLSFSLVSLDGCGPPSLVVTKDACDPAVGTSRWDAYAPSTAGFNPQPSPVALPAPRCMTSFDKTAGGASSLGFTLLSEQAKQAPALVVTHDGCDASVGVTHWDAYHAH